MGSSKRPKTASKSVAVLESKPDKKKQHVKQFGTDQCESLSKLAKIAGIQFISLHEKQVRIETKNAF